MPELPEIHNLAKQMHSALRGKTITAVDVRQPKCLNVPANRFRALVNRKTVGGATARGKWVFVALDPGAYLLLSLGMGGDCLYHNAAAQLPERYQVMLGFRDSSALTIAFSWFGYAHALKAADLGSHKMTASLGISPLDGRKFTYARFAALLDGRKGAIKPVLMDQSVIAGIGNLYIQDVLFKAKLHPARRIPDIAEQERKALFQAIRDNLRAATGLGGLAYERDLHGRHGRFKDFLVGYKEGQPCPECAATIQKVRTGSTAQFICPKCQT